jgi:hypothetical protein
LATATCRGDLSSCRSKAKFSPKKLVDDFLMIFDEFEIDDF